MTPELRAQMADDARQAKLAAEQHAGKNLTQLGVMALQMEQEIEDTETILAAKKKELERIMRYSVPAALSVAGIPTFGFEHGNGHASIKKDMKIRGTLANAPDQDAAVAYLEANGLPSVVKTSVTVEFTEAEREQAHELVDALREQIDQAPALDRKINPMTLMAFVRQKLKDDPLFDFEKVGCVAYPEAKFTKRR